MTEWIRLAWSRETSADPDGWTPENPAYGQCAVTALAVQDELGGELRRAVVNGVSHYWNLLPDGRHLDLTLSQFESPLRYEPDAKGESRDRAYVLSFPETAERYELLTSANVAVGDFATKNGFESRRPSGREQA